MKKLLFLLVLLAASLVLVSCPHPDTPGNSDNPVDFTSPVSIYSLYDFTEFSQGFWQSLDDADDYFWVTPTEIILSDSLEANNTRSELSSYTVTSNIYAEYVNNFPLSSSVKFNYKTIFSGGSSIEIGSNSSKILSFFGEPESGYPFVEYNTGYKYYIGVKKDNAWQYSWYYKADEYTHNTITLDDVKGTYVFSDATSGQYNGAIVIDNDEWHYYGENSNPEAATGTVDFVCNDIKFNWSYFSQRYNENWERSSTYRITKEGSNVILKAVDNNFNDFFTDIMGNQQNTLTFTWSNNVDFDSSIYDVSLEDFVGTYTFTAWYSDEYDGRIIISDGNWSYSGDNPSPEASSGTVTVDGRKLKFSWDAAGDTEYESYEIIMDDSAARWNSTGSSVFFHMLFGSYNSSNHPFDYSADTSGGGALTDYIGSYSFTTASGSQTNGSITISDGTWSFESSKAGNTLTAESVEMVGDSVKLTYTMAGMTLDEVFAITNDGSSSTWHCTESGGNTAMVSVIFSGLFGVTDLEMTFEYAE